VKNNQDLQELLNEVSQAVSKSMAEPEILEKLEILHKRGFRLYLVMESGKGEETGESELPILPIQVSAKPVESASAKASELQLSKRDKDFLRTLKIKVD
jgi:hypothetical protein